MKQKSPSRFLILVLLAVAGCGKDKPPAPITSNAACQPVGFSSTEGGNFTSAAFSYGADGNIATIKYSLQNVLQNTEQVVYNATSTTQPASVRAGLTDSFNVYYDADIFNHLPGSARVWITLDGITQVDYKLYAYVYDTKNRLIKVKESTPHITTDYEYDLLITYNDLDNVTALNFVTTTGPAGTTTVLATGYDDKPTPYAGIKNWPFIMRKDWTNYDPGPILTALSKNNPTGYTFNGYTRSSVFTYSDKGFPVRIVHTNSTASASASFTENYTYQCK
jgi:hypothetical protein